MALPLVIVGAGIAGLAAALVLARGRFDVVVLERRPALPDEGAGLQIGPNGSHVLRRLGLFEAIAAHGIEQHQIFVAAAGRERPLTKLPLGAWMRERHGAPYLTARRTHVLQALHAAARAAGVDVRFGISVAKVVQSTNAVEVMTSTGETIRGAALIGADGVWSQVRLRAFGLAEPSLTGRVAVRALLADSHADDAGGTINVTMAPDAHLVRYRVTKQDTNVVLISRGVQNGARWSEAIDASAVAARLAVFGERAVSLARQSDDWRQWPLVEAPRMTSYAQGRIVLIGDAAHAMMPFLAQGAVMALEDAEALAQAVARANDDMAQAFRDFSTARLPRTQRVVSASERNGRLYHLSGAMALARNAGLAAVPGSVVMRSYDWLYGGASEVPTLPA